MKCDRYLLTHTRNMSGTLKGFTEILSERVIWMPTDANEFNKKLESWREELKTGETMTFHKITVAKRFYQVEAAK